MTTTTLDLADLPALDRLDFQPPCQHSQHATNHPGDEPAAFLVQYARCTCGSPGGELLLCRPGWERVRRVVCRHCRATFTRDQAWTILAEIGGGR